MNALSFSHEALDSVLQAHVRDALVDYGALARDRGPLDRYLAATQAARPDAWARNEQIAFWVSVYNARVLNGVVRRPGHKSVLDVGRALGVPTHAFFREQAVSGGRGLSLNDIEHEILRKGLLEARVDFVLNCGSASCPALPAQALSAEALDSTLDAATRTFLLDRSKNEIEPGPELGLSSIKWYRSDFETAAGSLAAFVQRHRPVAGVVRPDAPIRFIAYDWSLNGHW